MRKLFIFVLVLATQLLQAEVVQLDSVHVKVASKIYFTSDLVDLQKAFLVRICELQGKNPKFLTLIMSYYKDKDIDLNMSHEKLTDEKLSYKKNEFEVLVMTLKLIQVLVEQQVSIGKSVVGDVSTVCLKKISPNEFLKIKNWYDKLFFLDDLLELKASIEKDEKKKQIALKSILDSLDKQVKHEAMVKLE